jgi:type IV pilus assembly protein PilA
MNVMPKLKKIRSGFTLIELLVVIGILAILLTIVLIAINPARQFAQSNNTRRRSDINAMLNAIHQYSVDNRGNINALGIPQDDGDVDTGRPVTGIDDQPIATDDGAVPAEVDICDVLVPTYISALPVDPQHGFSTAVALGPQQIGVAVSNCALAYDTGYTVVRSSVANNIRITVYAPHAELTETIEVTR